MLALGRFKIYRFRSEPYELLMKHVRTFTPDNPRCLEYSVMARVLASRIDHKNVARIHSLNICTRILSTHAGSSLCIKQTSIESYVNYYALDLEQVVSQRRSSDWRFAPGEVWYLVNSLVELAAYLQSSHVSKQNARSPLVSFCPGISSFRLRDISKSTYTTCIPVHALPFRTKAPSLLSPHRQRLSVGIPLPAHCPIMPRTIEVACPGAAGSESIEDGRFRHRHGGTVGHAVQLHPQILCQPIQQRARTFFRPETAAEGLQITQRGVSTRAHQPTRTHGGTRA